MGMMHIAIEDSATVKDLLIAALLSVRVFLIIIAGMFLSLIITTVALSAGHHATTQPDGAPPGSGLLVLMVGFCLSPLVVFTLGLLLDPKTFRFWRTTIASNLG